MSTDAPEVGPPNGTWTETAAARRARVAPLFAAGKSTRAIARETGIPLSAVHRAKQQIEKAAIDRAGRQAAGSPEPPSSYVVTRVIDGAEVDVRRLTIEVYEHKVTKAIGRGLLHADKCDDPGTVLSALFASCFADDALHWLHRHGFVEWSDRGRAEGVTAGVNKLIARLPW